MISTKEDLKNVIELEKKDMAEIVQYVVTYEN